MTESLQPLIDVIRARIVEKTAGHGICEMCGTNSWSLANAISSPVELAPDEQGQLQLKLNRGWPLAAMICSNCGNTKFFSLPALGIDPNVFLKADAP